MSTFRALISIQELTHGRIARYLDPRECPYAVGQGSVAIECRDTDKATLDLLRGIAHDESALRCIAERACMRVLEGGCSVPIGIFSELTGGTMQLRGAVHSLDGSESAKAEHKAGVATVAQAESAGMALARALKAKGAKDILDRIPRSAGPTAKPT